MNLRSAHLKQALCSAHKIRGFTLIELMVTLTVLAIITMIATPSLASALENQKLKQAALELKIALQQARSQALLTSSEHALCLDVAGMTQASCAQALQHVQNLNSLQQNNKTTLLALDSKVSLKNASATVFVFSPQGYTIEQSITLCAGARSYTIQVYMPGHVEMLQGNACS